MVETLIEWLHEAAHSCLFHVIPSSKEEGMICLTTSKSVKMTFSSLNFLNNGHNMKDETLFLIKRKINKIINKTGSFQWSITRAVVKTMLHLFGTHAYWTEILYWKFSLRICVPLHPKLVPYLLLTHIREFYFSYRFFYYICWYWVFNCACLFFHLFRQFFNRFTI